MDDSNSLVPYEPSNEILKELRDIVETSREQAYQAVNLALLRRNWLLGRRIETEILKGERRAEYGLEIVKRLSKELTREFGAGFTKTNLYSFYQFYKAFPEIFDPASGTSMPALSWSHYRALLQVKDERARVVREGSGRPGVGGSYVAKEHRLAILLSSSLLTT